MTKKNFYYLFGILSLILAVSLGFIIIAKKNKYHLEDISNSTVTVQLKWLHNAQFAGMYLADSNGYYREKGLNVAFKEPSSNDQSGIDLVVSGKRDFAIISTIQLIDAVNQKKPVKAIAAIYQNSPAIFAARAENKINSPADFKNKVIGLTKKGVYPLTITNAMLAKGRVPTNLVSFKEIGFDPIENLANGNIDIASFYRTGADYEAKKNNISLTFIKPEDYDLNVYDDLIVTSDDMIANHPETVKAFMQATQKGWMQALENQQEAISATMMHTTGKYNDRSYEESILANSKELILPSGQRSIGMMTAEKWEKAYLIYKSSILSGNLDIRQAYTLDFF